MQKQNAYANLAKTGSYFIYDLDALEQHAHSLMQGVAKLFFACKANPLSAILSTLHKTGLCFDVASRGELQQVVSVGISGEQIILTGPAKPEALMRLALENQVATFVIESATQLTLLQTLVKEYGYTPKVLLRLQLAWQQQGKSVLGGNSITAFGMDVNTAKLLLSKLTLPLLGFHVFQWGNILSADKLREIWVETITVCKKLTTDFQVLDVGGGLGIPYNGEPPLNWERVNQVIREVKNHYCIPEFWLELGRFLTGACGEYMTRVVDIKHTYGKNTVVLEGGINHLARSALTQEAFPAELLRNSTASLKPFSLHGPLCTSLDFLGEHALPADLHIDDILIFKQTGAYGFTESMPFFLCHDLPGEAVIEQGTVRIVRQPAAPQLWLK